VTDPGYRVTAWRDRNGDIWERTPGGAWSTDGAAEVYDTTELLGAAWGPLAAVDVDVVEALLRHLDALRERLLRHAREEHANGWDEASAYLYGAAAVAADEKVMAALWRAAEEFRTTARGIRDTADRAEEVSGD
jgi:hypothetical protein